MKKKLKLIVMALCLAPMAFAQTDDTKQQEQNTIADEQAFTFTEAQLGEDDDMSQNVSIISSNQNIYASKVGFQFSPVRFRYRAFNQKYSSKPRTMLCRLWVVQTTTTSAPVTCVQVNTPQ